MNYLKKIGIIFTVVLSLLTSVQTVTAQSYNVNFTLDNYDSDTLIIGYYYANRQLVKDTLYSQDQKHFAWTGEEELHEGTYMALTTPRKDFIQFFVEEPYPNYEVRLDGKTMEIKSFTGSRDNQLFNEYIAFLNQKRPEVEGLKKELESAKDKAKIQAKIDAVDEQVFNEQARYTTEYAETFTAKTIKASMNIDYPEPPPGLSDRELEIYKYEQYRSHYFDHVDLGDSTLIYTPFLYNRVDYYINKLTIQMPDSIIVTIDDVLSKMHPESQMYRYVLSNFYNTYAKSKIVGMDAVVVHLVDAYYSAGKAPWIEEDLLAKMEDNAKKLKPTLIGKTGRDIQVELEDGTPIKLSEIDAEYLVLLFWAPDCGHCKKSMPDIIKFEEDFRDKNIKLVSVCTKYQDKVPSCWESVKEKGMENFINCVDPLGKSRFKSWYDVRSTPKIFILDKDLKIIIKGIGAEQLGGVMEEIMEK